MWSSMQHCPVAPGDICDKNKQTNKQQQNKLLPSSYLVHLEISNPTHYTPIFAKIFYGSNCVVTYKTMGADKHIYGRLLTLHLCWV